MMMNKRRRSSVKNEPVASRDILSSFCIPYLNDVLSRNRLRKFHLQSEHQCSGRLSQLFAFRRELSSLAPLDPIGQLAFPEPPLPADFQGWQIVAANHSLQSARRDLQQ